MMRRILLKCLPIMFVICALPATAQSFYVSPKGDDANSGTMVKPFFSIEKARDEARKHKQSEIILRGGSYILKKTLLLEPQDSNTTYKAFLGETPVITGGRLIKGWKALKENRLEISRKARGKLWVADIPKGWLFHYLFVNGERAERSKSSHEFWRNWPKDFKQGTPSKDGQPITFKNRKQLKYIPSNGDAEMVCITAQYGVMANGVITNVNPKKRTLVWNSRLLNITGSRNNLERGYRFENVLNFIDRPGEWAVDSTKGRVYYWPKNGEEMNEISVIAPKLNELVRLQGDEIGGKYVENVSFEGITFAYTDRLPENQWPDNWLCRQWENIDASLYFTGTKNCVVRDCRILHSGAYGITINHYGQNNRIENCEIGYTGSGGIFLEGYGPGTLDVNKNNVITRNYIHDHGLGNYWHSPSIQIYQSGHNTINYNLLQRSAYSSISMVGMHYLYMNDPRFFFPGSYHKGRQWHEWTFFCPRSQDFSQKIQDGIRNKTFKFDRESIKPYMHSRENIIEYNVISEPHSKLNEGGAIYAWCQGKGNIWRKNVIFKSRAMPGSSILALDDVAEYTTVVDNIFWINGTILNGVGARSGERGNVISKNIRINFQNKHEAIIKKGLGTWWVNSLGREPMDKLLNEITLKVEKQGGWLGHPEVGIPKPGEPITKYGEQITLPPGANVTIEE